MPASPPPPPSPSLSSSSSALLSSLHTTLNTLAASPYPHVTGPEPLRKRASVALIIRVQPQYDHWPAASSNPTRAPIRDIDSFFDQDWVKHGDPQVLFIKRAARKGDRWTSHVALPGGRRDPEDADDLAAAVRETSEEVGIHLTPENAIAVGNLPQRVVTTSWGKVPLMVLCPYIFLITNPNLPPLRLQPTEVASTHWVPLRALLSASNRTVSFEDVSNRLANQETGVKRYMLWAMLGKMEFAAIRLLPSESLQSSSSPAVDPDPNGKHASFFANLWSYHKAPAPSPQSQPLLLWGLTLGIMADFLDMLPPHNALHLWTYPTFTPPDVRFAIWAMTHKFKQRKLAEAHSSNPPGPAPSAIATEPELDAADVPRKMHSSRYIRRSVSLSQSQTLPARQQAEGQSIPPQHDTHDEVGMPGLGSGRAIRTRNVNSAVGTMLEGYYDLVRKAVAVALVGRTSVLLLVFAWLFVRLRRKSSGRQVPRLG